jgi:hypothetical protein
MQLRNYQLEPVSKAVDVLMKYKIVYLSAEVRVGKTFMSLMTAQGAMTSGLQVKKVCFVTGKKIIPSIQKDYDHGTYDYDMLITNYEQVSKVDASQIDLWILDEAHKLGQFPKPSLRTISLREKINGKPVILLSGTPTPESFSQIYHQLWVTGNSPFDHKSFYKWADEFVSVWKRDIKGFKVNDYKKAKTELIMPIIEHLFVTVTQEDAGFKSIVEEKFIYHKMINDVEIMAKKLEKNNVFIGSIEIVAGDPAALINKLSQLAGGTVIDESGATIIFDSSKALLIKNKFKGLRIAIFYRYKGERSILMNVFDYITEDWQAFQRGEADVFISQVQSGREGIDLSSADAVVMYNIDFSATSYWQARARLQSWARDRPALVYWVFSTNIGGEGGIEQQVYNSVQKKKSFTHRYYKKSHAAKKTFGKTDPIQNNSPAKRSWIYDL